MKIRTERFVYLELGEDSCDGLAENILALMTDAGVDHARMEQDYGYLYRILRDIE